MKIEKTASPLLTALRNLSSPANHSHDNILPDQFNTQVKETPKGQHDTDLLAKFIDGADQSIPDTFQDLSAEEALSMLDNEDFNSALDQLFEETSHLESLEAETLSETASEEEMIEEQNEYIEAPAEKEEEQQEHFYQEEEHTAEERLEEDEEEEEGQEFEAALKEKKYLKEEKSDSGKPQEKLREFKSCDEEHNPTGQTAHQQNLQDTYNEVTEYQTEHSEPELFTPETHDTV